MAEGINDSVRVALVQAMAECILHRASDQVSFIADRIETVHKSIMASSPDVDRNPHIHELPSIENLCTELENQTTDTNVYTRKVMEALLAFIACPEGQYGVCRNANSEVPLPIKRLFLFITDNLMKLYILLLMSTQPTLSKPSFPFTNVSRR